MILNLQTLPPCANTESNW